MTEGEAATAALIRRIEGGDGALMAFDGADLSAEGVGDAGAGQDWWDAAAEGARMAGLDLRGAGLRGAKLPGSDLTGAVLAGAVCSGVVLRRARLEQADLSGADLVGADLAAADAGQANFSDCLLEDSVFTGARLRFAALRGAVMDGADFSGADLWGAGMQGVAAERAVFRAARLDEADLKGADLAMADLTGATLRRADLAGARLRGAVLREAVLDGANLTGADLRGAVLPHLDLGGCTLKDVRVSGAWLERTRLRAHQLGAAIGEEAEGDFAAAREGYIALEQNFRSLGNYDDASWAFRRRRRMGKRVNAQAARAAWQGRQWRAAWRPTMGWLADLAAEWVCDYGESVGRVMRTLLVTLVVFALVYWMTGCLEWNANATRGAHSAVVDYLLFSLDSMTTVGTGQVGLRPASQFGVLLSSIETVLGTVQLGLLGFVLGGRMRR